MRYSERVHKLFNLSSGYTPRWVIFSLDLIICTFSFVGANILRYNFTLSSEDFNNFISTLPLVIAIRLVYFILFRTYSGIIRYTGTQDAIRLFKATGFGSVTILSISLLYFYNSPESKVLVPTSIIIIDFVSAVFLLTSFRLAAKILYVQLTRSSEEKKRVAIFGAGQAGLITKRTLDQDRSANVKVVAFFDDELSKSGKTVEGVKIFNGGQDLKIVLPKYGIDELIISTSSLSLQRKQQIIEECLQHNIKVLNVPPVDKWINGELSFHQLKNVRIEDLIERDTIELDKKIIARQLKGKKVMITGAAGSIGSEIVRQLLPFFPDKILLVDKAETPLYHLENELIEVDKSALGNNIELFVADVCDKTRMKSLFELYKPDIIYHAAAYKHVPLMESNPSEAIKTNVLGTKTMADLAVEFGAEKFVFVSTDKAVNPTNIMGASKRIAEIYIQSLNNSEQYNYCKTRFITTRFGNVLGSNGSVIPRFRKQIEEGGPITVTHPDITRFFMTIPEACQLVLEAGAMGKGGEIFIFDMGKSIKIVDLAKKMVKLSGLTLGRDIQIVFTGLRPGEKIKEELLNDSENTIATHHPKIMIAKVRTYDFHAVKQDTNVLLDINLKQKEEDIVRKMKDIVPEYISRNSVYSSLDKNPHLQEN
jgi:FlaA1/EpsC-like NDP-sugar epimerase